MRYVAGAPHQIHLRSWCLRTRTSLALALRSTLATGAVLTVGLMLTSGCTVRLNNPLRVGRSTALVTNQATVTTTSTTIPLDMTLVAGQRFPQGNVDGAAASAQFAYPTGITSDGTTYLYVADEYSHTIRRVTIATGAVTTIAGVPWQTGSTDGAGSVAKFYFPRGLALIGSTLYVADMYNHTIRAIDTSTFVVSTVAGIQGSAGLTNSTLLASRFNYPRGIVAVGSDLYVVDTENNRIRRVDIGGNAVTTFAGGATCATSNGTGTAARFCFPEGITADATYLYVTDNGDRIRRIVISTAAVTTLGCDGDQIAGLPAVDGTYIYYRSGESVRRCTVAGGVGSAYLGGMYNPGSADGTGTAAQFHYPYGVTLVGTDLYIADTSNHMIRKADNSGVVTSLSATNQLGITPKIFDGTGASARFESVQQLVSDGTYIYASDAFHSYTEKGIRRINVSTGEVTTFAGGGASGSADGIGGAASFNMPGAMAYDGVDTIYIADTYSCTIRKLTISTQAVTTWLGVAGSCSVVNGAAASVRFENLSAIAIDSTYLYISEGDRHIIRRASLATGATTTIAGAYNVPASTDGVGTAARFIYPGYMHVADSTLYISSGNYYGDHSIRAMDTGTLNVTTLAGSGTAGYVDATGTSASFWVPNAMASDGSFLYVADTANAVIRKINRSTGAVTTVLGLALVSQAVTGTISASRLYYPTALAILGPYLYIGDASAVYRAPLSGL